MSLLLFRFRVSRSSLSSPQSYYKVATTKCCVLLLFTKEKDTARGQDMQSAIRRVWGVIDTRNSIQPLWLSLIIFLAEVCLLAEKKSLGKKEDMIPMVFEYDTEEREKRRYLLSGGFKLSNWGWRRGDQSIHPSRWKGNFKYTWRRMTSNGYRTQDRR